MMSETMLKPQEVADRLRISRRHVYDLIQEGEIPAVRVGNVWRIPESVMEQRFREQWQGKS